MQLNASWQLRMLYCLAVLSVIIPFGMSGWVAATVGPRPALLTPHLPYLAAITLLLLGIWRIYLVARYSNTLDSYVFDAGTKALRILGIVGMVVGALYLILRFGSGPMIKLLLGSRRTISGAEFYVAGVYLTFIAGVGPLGILLFETSRLFGFERNHRKKRSESSTQSIDS